MRTREDYYSICVAKLLYHMSEVLSINREANIEREFAMRGGQRGKRGGMGEVLAFVRRMTQDTAFGGMRTSPQAAVRSLRNIKKGQPPNGD